MTRGMKTFLFCCIVGWLLLSPLVGYQTYERRLKKDFAYTTRDVETLMPLGRSRVTQRRSDVRARAYISGFISTGILIAFFGGVGGALWFTSPLSSRRKTESPE